MSAAPGVIAVHTLNEAAEILRVKQSWLERRAAARVIPFTMLGGSYHFTAEHLAAIIELHENRPKPVSPPAARAIKLSSPESALRSHDLQARPLRPRPRRAA
jgi:excisionase family DNA binding protein